MRVQLTIGLVLVVLATLTSGGILPKRSLVHNWNDTSGGFLSAFPTPVTKDVTLTDIVTLTNAVTLIDTVTITDAITVTLSLETVYVTIVSEPTIGCLASLNPGADSGQNSHQSDPHGGISTVPIVTPVVETSYITYTETIPVVSVTKTSYTSEVPGSVPDNGRNSYHHAKSGASQAVTVSPIPEDTMITTKDTTTTITSTVTNVMTTTLTSADASSVPSKQPTSLRFSGVGSGGWNVTHPSTVNNGSVSVFVPIFKHAKTYPTEPVPVSHLQKRGVDEWVTATVNGIIVSWTNNYYGSKPTVTPITSKNPGGPKSPEHQASPPQTFNIGPHSVTHPSVNSASSTPALPSPTPTSCGEIGNFRIDFDNLPAPPGEPNLFPPIFSPYHHFLFSDGWSYGTSLQGFVPVSPPYMAVHIPDAEIGDAEDETQFGVGPRLADDRFWFNASSFFFGCESEMTGPCKVTVSAFKYSPQAGAEYNVDVQVVNVPTCPGLKNCSFTPIQLGVSFQGLTSIAFNATVANTSVPWVLDDIQLGWYDNTCAAGEIRAHSA